MPQIVDSLSAEMYLLIMPVKMINGKCLEKLDYNRTKMHCGAKAGKNKLVLFVNKMETFNKTEII